MNIWNRWKIPILIGVLGISFWFLSSPLFYNQGKLIPPLSDYWDYAQQGRELARGQGFNSLYTYPVLLHYTHQATFPNLWRPPIYPFLIGLGYKISGNDKIPLVYWGLISYVLLIICIVRFYNDYTGTRLGWIAGLIYGLTPIVLKSSLSGLSEPVFSFWVLVLFYQLWKIQTKNSLNWIDYAGLGFIFGIGWLTRSEMILFLPPLLWYLFQNHTHNLPSKIRGIRLFLIVVILVMLPWWIRNYLITGNPFFNMSNQLILMFTPSFPGWIKFRMLPDTLSTFSLILQHSLELLVKTSHYLVSNLKGIFTLHPLMVPLFFLGFYLKDALQKSSWDNLVLSSLIILWIGISVLEPDPRFFLSILPMMIIMGTHVLVLGIQTLKNIWKVREWNLYLVILLILSLPLVSGWIKYPITKTGTRVENPEWITIQETLNRDLNQVLITDIPDQVAWRTGIRTLWIPLWNELPQILKSESHLQGILLTPIILKIQDDPDIRQWKLTFKNGSDIPGFRLMKIFPDGSLYYQKTD